MADYARGRDVLIQSVMINDDGSREIIDIGYPVSADFAMDITTERDERLGQYESDTVAMYEGESGSMTFRMDSHVFLKIQNRIRNAARSRTGTPKFQILRTVYVPEILSSKTVRYPNVVFSISESVAGKTDAVEVTVEWISGFAEEL